MKWGDYILKLEDVLIKGDREFKFVIGGRRRMNILQLIAFLNLINSQGNNGIIYYETDEVQGGKREITEAYLDGDGNIIFK